MLNTLRTETVHHSNVTKNSRPVPNRDYALEIRPRLASHEDMKMDLVGISVFRTLCTDKCGETTTMVLIGSFGPGFERQDGNLR